MTGDWTPLLGLLTAFTILLLLNRWINQHIQGVGLLLTGSEEATGLLYFLVLFPGILLHELSHWLMAKLLGLKTGKISLGPSKKRRAYLQLGSVEVERGGPFLDSLVGAAPLLTGCAFLILVSHRVFNVQGLVQELLYGNWETLWERLAAFLSTKDFWIWLYLVFSISNAMMPSPRDREPWKPVLLFLGLMAGAFYFGGWMPRIPPTAATIARQWAATLAYGLGFVAFIDALWALGLVILERALEAVTGRRVLY